MRETIEEQNQHICLLYTSSFFHCSTAVGNKKEKMTKFDKYSKKDSKSPGAKPAGRKTFPSGG